MSTLDGAAILEIELAYPKFGAWRADVTLIGGDAPVEGAATVLVVGDLELHGTVLRSGLDAPDKPHAIVVGAPGWEKPLTKALTYQSDSAVRLSTVLRDLAALAGEPIEQPADVEIGAYFECPAQRGPEAMRLRDVLAALYHAGNLAKWRVDPDGVTRFGPRVGAPITARATEIRRNPALGLIVLGIDSPAAFLPGGALEDGTIVHRLIVRETSGKLEADVWSAVTPSIRGLIRRIVREEFAHLDYAYPRTMIVHSVGSDKRLDLSAPPDAPHYAEIENCEQWSLGGAMVTPAEGAEVCVMFRDRKPTRPIVVPWGTGTPDELDLEGSDEVGITGGDIKLKGGLTGVPANEHATSVEALSVILLNFAAALGVAAGPPLSTAMLALLPSNFPGGTASPGSDIVSLVLTAAASPTFGTIATCSSTITSMLAAKLPDVTGLLPGIGWPHVEGG